MPHPRMPASMEYLLEDINRVRKDVDLIIVSALGKEYVDAPTEFQYEFARLPLMQVQTSCLASSPCSTGH